VDRDDALFDRHPAFTEIGRYFYDSLIYQQIIVPFVLILLRQYRAAQLTVLILITSLILTHMIALFLPAVSSYPFHEINPSQHPNIRLSQENIFVPHVQALRAGATVDLDQPPWFAVTTFPSLHSTMAVVFAWALRMGRALRQWHDADLHAAARKSLPRRRDRRRGARHCRNPCFAMAHADIGRPFGAGRHRLEVGAIAGRAIVVATTRPPRLPDPPVGASIAAHGLERCTLGTRAVEGRRRSNEYWNHRKASAAERRKNPHGQ